jgi:hypothetical protein
MSDNFKAYGTIARRALADIVKQTKHDDVLQAQVTGTGRPRHLVPYPRTDRRR